MAYLLTLLAVLACPLMMGLTMWLMMRVGQRRGDGSSPTVAPASRNTSRRSVFGRWCLNWKVVALLSWGLFAVWLLAPSVVWVALPFVIMAACPLSMLLMMRGMGGHQGATKREQEQLAGVSLKSHVRQDELQARYDGVTRERAEVETRVD